jgi:hypothetical protein
MKPGAKSLLGTAGLLLAGLTAFTQQAYAQGGVPLWTNVSSGAAYALAVGR